MVIEVVTGVATEVTEAIVLMGVGGEGELEFDGCHFTTEFEYRGRGRGY